MLIKDVCWSFLVGGFLITIVSQAAAQCEYYQQMEVGKTYYIYNQEYPNNYPVGTQCVWNAQSPEGTRIVLQCTDVSVPCKDVFVISTTGDPNFGDASNRCGWSNANEVSVSNSMSIGVFSFFNRGRISCEITTLETCDCGWQQQKRIVGGQETGVNQFPFMAALIDLTKRQVWCGSTIISNRFVVTAGHCIYNAQKQNFRISVGDHDFKKDDETKYAALYEIQSYLVHNQYNPQSFDNDIAIIQTVKAINFSMAVGPVCLPFYLNTASTPEAGTSVTVLGWGSTEFSGPISNYLQAANLTAITNSQCQKSYPSLNIGAGRFCTYTPGKDACQFDSGGPLISYDNMSKRFKLMGSVSQGMACADASPGINVRISYYLQWIQDVTKENFCKK